MIASAGVRGVAGSGAIGVANPGVDGVLGTGVDVLGEKFPLTGHVVGGAGIEAPPRSLLLPGAITKKSVRFGLVEVEESLCDWCR